MGPRPSPLALGRAACLRDDRDAVRGQGHAEGAANLEDRAIMIDGRDLAGGVVGRAGGIVPGEFPAAPQGLDDFEEFLGASVAP